VLGLLCSPGTPLNVSSLMGMVIGGRIVAENGVFLLFYAETFHAAGEDLGAAPPPCGPLRRAADRHDHARSRLALLRSRLVSAPAPEIQKPLAIAVIGRLLAVGAVAAVRVRALPLVRRMTSRCPRLHLAPAAMVGR